MKTQSTPSVYWKRLALLFGSILFACVLAEIGLRALTPVKAFVNPMSSFHVSDPELGWRGAPNLEARFRQVDFDVLVRLDPDGFRVREAATSSRPDSPIIAVFGDSFTWGYGVANGKLFTDVLQNQMGAGADVRNFGVNAFGTVQELLLLRRALSIGLRPAWVVVMIFSNDYQDNLDDSGVRPTVQAIKTNLTGTSPTLSISPVTRFAINPYRQWLKKSHLLSYIAYVVDFRKERRHVLDLQSVTYQQGHMAEAPRHAMAWTLEQFKETCRIAESRLFCAYVPTLQEVAADGAKPDLKVSRDLCAQLSIPFLDLTPGMSEAGGNHPWRLYFPHDQHWTDAGHAVAGGLLAKFLKHDLSASASPQ